MTKRLLTLALASALLPVTAVCASEDEMVYEYETVECSVDNFDETIYKPNWITLFDDLTFAAPYEWTDLEITSHDIEKGLLFETSDIRNNYTLSVRTYTVEETEELGFSQNVDRIFEVLDLQNCPALTELYYMDDDFWGIAFLDSKHSTGYILLPMEDKTISISFPNYKGNDETYMAVVQNCIQSIHFES